MGSGDCGLGLPARARSLFSILLPAGPPAGQVGSWPVGRRPACSETPLKRRARIPGTSPKGWPSGGGGPHREGAGPAAIRVAQSPAESANRDPSPLIRVYDSESEPANPSARLRARESEPAACAAAAAAAHTRILPSSNASRRQIRVRAIERKRAETASR